MYVVRIINPEKQMIKAESAYEDREKAVEAVEHLLRFFKAFDYRIEVIWEDS